MATTSIIGGNNMNIITKDVKDAMDILYKRHLKVSQSKNNIRDLEAIDLALDELTRNSNRTGLPYMLAAFAVKSAYKKLTWRGKYHQGFNDDDFACSIMSSLDYSCTDDINYKVIEIRDFIKTSLIKESYKEVLEYLEEGLEVEEIAKIKDVTKFQVRVWVTRARKKIHSEWDMVS